jgi:hypothetical protein
MVDHPDCTPEKPWTDTGSFGVGGEVASWVGDDGGFVLYYDCGQCWFNAHGERCG